MNLKLTIDRLEGEKVVLIADDGTIINWPKSKLPSNAREGIILNFNILSDLETEKNKKELAKDILNEILNTHD